MIKCRVCNQTEDSAIHSSNSGVSAHPFVDPRRIVAVKTVGSVPAVVWILVALLLVLAAVL